MRFEEFYAERIRVVREVEDVQVLAAEVERLRALAETVDDDRDKARRYVEATEKLLLAASAPRSETLDRAFEAMLRARQLPDGTPAEQRAHVEAGMDEIARIAAEAPNAAERDVVLELNETLMRTRWRIELSRHDGP